MDTKQELDCSPQQNCIPKNSNHFPIEVAIILHIFYKVQENAFSDTKWHQIMSNCHGVTRCQFYRFLDDLLHVRFLHISLWLAHAHQRSKQMNMVFDGEHMGTSYGIMPSKLVTGSFLVHMDNFEMTAPPTVSTSELCCRTSDHHNLLVVMMHMTADHFYWCRIVTESL